MKFLEKQAGSVILREGLKYLKNRPKENCHLRDMLRKEQKGFCAYTEKRLGNLDSDEVEHFNPRKKYNDDYFNYYCIIRSANLRKRKKEKSHMNSTFFKSLFFQNKADFTSRIRFVPGDNLYENIDEDDHEAEQLIDYLGFNDNGLFRERQNHVNTLRDLFEEAQYGTNNIIDWFRNHPEHLTFVSAIEAEFGLDLSKEY